ncbi:Protein NRT1/ PTR FAMILY 1.2 like [Actinidia chinensis var. chinensis]|uniref:Protein NRT1/ PTR FAMILY 1.2 like n=1 Tax=Actinidia chinensis var. chinensis TaxID=1590841 RepID=A0A2R6Q4V6_ACTCC|nr:Protein NRT1/ PTR FAMILY 1.2 like [Actinidia chinensis var. chinensis]
MEVSSDPVQPTQQASTRKGGLRTMPFVIANEAFEKVASVGLHANMILYLTVVYNLSNATGTSILFLWNAISNFMPTLGAFLSDSYLGRFRVIGCGTVVSLLGLILLWFTAIFRQVRPPSCDQTTGNCISPNSAQLAMLFSSFALMSIGSGGIRPCSLAFGADQLDKPENPNNAQVLQSFFNWYYASVGISIMISVTVIVYIQTEAGWVLGFGVPVGLMLFSTVMFFLGSPLYVKIKANKSLITGLAQVVIAAVRNRHLALPPKDSDGWYHHNKDSRLVAPTEKLRFLNKACIIRNPAKDIETDGKSTEPCNICTVQEVEVLKALIKVIPIWSAGIVIAVTISQQAFPVLQASTMDRHFINNFEIPPGSFGVFGILTLTIWVVIYDRVVVPWLRKYTKLPRGLSLKQRMGIGLLLSCVGTSVAALVETERRRRAINEGLENQPHGLVKMSAMWLVPQHCITGIAEAFNIIGQIEFYYSQFPKSMSSIAVALFSLGLGVGNLVGSLIVVILDHVTKQGGNVSWVSNNLNKGHYDYYYWVVAILCVANFFYFLLCGWAYGPEEQNVWDDGEAKIDEEIPIPIGSPTLF